MPKKIHQCSPAERKVMDGMLTQARYFEQRAMGAMALMLELDACDSTLNWHYDQATGTCTLVGPQPVIMPPPPGAAVMDSVE